LPRPATYFRAYDHDPPIHDQFQSRMINSQTHLALVMGSPHQMRPLPSFSLRGNQTINRALRTAYRKFDRSAETERLLRKYLPRWSFM